MKNIILIFLLIILFSCAKNEEKSEVISLQDEVILVHDTAMAKMDLIMTTKRNLKKLKGIVSDSSKFNEIDSALYMLTVADKEMMKWMREYKLQSDSSNIDSAISYLSEELLKIEKVSEQINKSIEYGKSILNEK